MTDHIHTDPDHTSTTVPDGTVTTAATATPVATEAPAAVVVEPAQPIRRFNTGSFIAGFVTAIVVAALAFVVFLVVSDSDDDGNIQVDVPAVDVDTDG